VAFVGLTGQSTGLATIRRISRIQGQSSTDIVVALAGNPNTGKSTVFNSLTGLKQHTGNWPGKTVTNACGWYGHNGRNFVLVDLPGTYSLMANSPEEEVARDFICFGDPHATVVVVDATCMERNLNLVFQILEITPRVVVCVNLMDEAYRKGIQVDLKRLSDILGIPVVGTSALKGQGLDRLKEAVWEVVCDKVKPHPVIEYDDAVEEALGLLEPQIKALMAGRDCNISSRWLALRILEGDQVIIKVLKQYAEMDILASAELMQKVSEAWDMLAGRGINADQLRDRLISTLIRKAEEISREVVRCRETLYNRLDYKIDDVLTSKVWGIPIMLALLGVIFWITIEAANYPSQVLSAVFFYLEQKLIELFTAFNAPAWLSGLLVEGMYRTMAWVVSVMLPPMAIFFPLFTLLEDLGYLPRVAFNLDNFFKKACAHGKQALTMCMGFGCNAAGVIACRIIDSPRERLIAIITNNYVPCNGRFPTLIALSTIFIAAGATGAFKSIVATLTVLGIIVLGVLITLIVSKILSKTILRGLPSSFVLELPPYRKPQVGKILVRSLLDRTLFVLGRAVTVAAPAGLIIWSMANIFIADMNLLDYAANFLDPFARLIGLDGYILMAFILGLPANEIVIPIVIMSYMSTGVMMELDSLDALRELLVNNGWTWLTAVCTMLFSINHFPCGTTLLTIRKETRSMKWTAISFLVPIATGIIVCFIVAQLVRILGLV